MKKNGRSLRNYAIFIVFLLEVLFFALMNKNFFTVSNALNVLRQSAMIGVTAVGVMMVLLIGGIDLSPGSQVAFVNILCAYLMVRAEWGIIPSILVCLLVSMASGLMMGLLVTLCKIPPFIATLAFMNILEGVALTICGGLPISGFDPAFKVIGQGYVGIVPVPVIIMIVAFIICGILLSKTYFGRYLYAIGGNEEAARLSGINVSAYKCIVYSLSALCASIGGIISLSRLNSGSPKTGSGLEFDVITALVLGGVSISGGYGKTSGAIVGVLIMSVLKNGLTMMNVDDYTQTIISGVVLALAVSIDCLQRKSTGKKVLVSSKA